MVERKNKGEWSEFYVLLKLLADGKIFNADKNVRKMSNIFFPIIKIIREEKGKQIDYNINSSNGEVEIYYNMQPVKVIKNEQMQRMATYIYNEILRGNSRAFGIEDAEKIMTIMECTKVAASSTDKTDINMIIHDTYTGIEQKCGFSIKSELGSAPTLLNASGATNFVFEVQGLNYLDMVRINNINTSTKILDRIKAICDIGKMNFVKAKNENFSANLRLIDSCMETIIAEMLIFYYRDNYVDCSAAVNVLEEINPLGYPRRGFYEYKFKKFLCSIALGMMPSKPWSGLDEANGGYIIVKQDGDVLAYHLYNRNAFEEYLLKNTKFDRGSTTKNGFAVVYQETDGRMYINLNLQIRFK